ncbi:MAG: ABC transporter permease [Thermoanaerobaculia bacterium]
MSPLHGTLALFRGFLTESVRSKASLFWTLAFPLLFLFVFGAIFGGGKPEGVAYLMPGLLTISVMAGSLFGVAFRMIVARENGVLRRLRVTPVTSLAIVVAYGMVALILLVATFALQLGTAKAIWRIPIAGPMASLALVALAGFFAFVPLGLFVGSAARDMRTAPPLANLIFFPMMFLSGSAVPYAILPPWLQTAGRLLPATYLVESLQGVIVRNDPLARLSAPLAILVLTGLVGVFMNALLFRWESSEPVDRKKLALALASLGVFLVLVAFLAPEMEMRNLGWGGGPPR